jgi:hypothetical protein
MAEYQNGMKIRITTLAIVHCGGIFCRKFHAFLLSSVYGGKNPADFSATKP